MAFQINLKNQHLTIFGAIILITLIIRLSLAATGSNVVNPGHPLSQTWIDADLDMGGNGVTNAGNIGIGIAIPAERLDVQGGNIRTSGFIYSTQDSYPQTYLRSWGLSGVGNIYIEPAVGHNLFLTDSWSRTGLLDMEFGEYNILGGNVGIGTSEPGTAKLNVSGNIYSSADVCIPGKCLSTVGVGAGGVTSVSTPVGSGLTLNPDPITSTGTISMMHPFMSCAVGSYMNNFNFDTGVANCLSGVTGTGMQNNLTKWLPGNSVGNSIVYDNGANVGVGTASPTGRLDVRGNIKLGATGDLYAPGGEENLRLIRGIVNGDGGIAAGSGFSVVHTATGRYTVTFTTPFTAEPSVTATVQSAPDSYGSSPFSDFAAAMIDNTVAKNSAQFGVFLSDNFNLNDAKWEFIAIGPR